MEVLGLTALIAVIGLWVRLECSRIDLNRSIDQSSRGSTRHCLSLWDAVHDRRRDIEDLSRRVAALESIRMAETQTVDPAYPVCCRCSRCKGDTIRHIEGLAVRDGILWFNHAEKKVEPICFSCCDKAGIPRKGGVT